MIPEFKSIRIYLTNLESQIEDLIRQARQFQQDNNILKEEINKLNDIIKNLKTKKEGESK